MDIQVRTDHHVRGEEALIEFIEDEVERGLRTYAARIASAHVHVSLSAGGHRRPTELSCTLEVRPHGHAALAVTRHATTTSTAVRGAASDMKQVLVRMFRRSDGRHPGAPSIRRPGA